MTTDIDYTDADAMGFPTSLRAGQAFQVSHSFDIPKGTLQDAEFFAGKSSQTSNVFPVT